MKIKSISSVITNSSSETFTVKVNNELGIQNLIDAIEKHVLDHMWYKGPWGNNWVEFCKQSQEEKNKWNSFSGDSKEPTIEDWKASFELWKKTHFTRASQDKITIDMWLYSKDKPLEELKLLVDVCLDNNFIPTRMWLIETFRVIDCDCCGWHYDDTGRIDRPTTNWKEKSNQPEYNYEENYYDWREACSESAKTIECKKW